MINGHKWFISNAHRASFAILDRAAPRTTPTCPQAANTGVHRRHPVARAGTRCARSRPCTARPATPRSASRTCACPTTHMLGGRGQGHLLGQYRLGPARLAHCMRWIAQAETALDMMVDRSLNRFAHGSLLAEKQGIQWMIADSTMELYQAKLMVLHAAYRIDHGLDFKSEVSMAKHFVANALGRIIDRVDPGARRARLLDRHAARPHVPARPLGPLRRRRRRGAPDAHRPAHHRRLEGPRHHPHRHGRPADLSRPPAGAGRLGVGRRLVAPGVTAPSSGTPGWARPSPPAAPGRARWPAPRPAGAAGPSPGRRGCASGGPRGAAPRPGCRATRP